MCGMATLAMDNAAPHGWHWADNQMHLAHDMAKQTDLDWDLVQCMASLAMEIGLAHGWHMGH